MTWADLFEAAPADVTLDAVRETLDRHRESDD